MTTETAQGKKTRLVCKINPHGVAAKKRVTIRKVNREQLMRGIEVELEHTRSRAVACGIALDHLAESKNYYALLDLVEAALRVVD